MALWDGRFEGSPAQEMQEFGASMDTDLQMWREDITGSRAHAKMLCSVGLLSDQECEEILRGLTLVETDLQNGWVPSIEDEENS